MSHPITEPTGVEIDHPDWCDRTLCTVTPAADVREDHRGQPVTFRGKHGFPVPLTVTASLCQPAKYPMAGPYLALEVHGLDHEYQTVGGTARIPAEHAATLATMLLDLAATAGAAAGQSTSGTPRAVLRPDDDVIDLVGRGGRVPVTFPEARDIEDQVSAILAVFDPQRLANNEVMNDILTREYLTPESDHAGGGQ